MSMDSIVISTTVPDTLSYILKGQPRYLARYFTVTLASSPGVILEQVEVSEGVAAHGISMERGISIYRDVISIFSMLKLLIKTRPRIVHSYTPKAGLVSMIAAYLCGVPVRVHTFTGLIFPTSTGFKRHLLIWTDRLICLCATHVVPEGSGVKKDLERFGITRKPLEVIGSGNIAGVDTEHFSRDYNRLGEMSSKLRDELRIGVNEFVFCFVGRLNRDKGLAELMEAFEKISTPAHILLVGEVDQTAPVGKSVLAAMGKHPRVHRLGSMADVRPVLRAANVLVLPSYREGFPNVVLEAGAMALPVIASDINGCNEVIESGINGWLVPARDATALQKAMEDAMSMQDEDRAVMGRNARERVKANFERRQHWDRMVMFYQELLGKNPVA